MDNVGCSGSESKLISCRHNGYGSHDCRHYEDVGISCTGVYNCVYVYLKFINLSSVEPLYYGHCLGTKEHVFCYAGVSAT